MRWNKTSFQTICALLGLLVLIFDSQLAQQGALAGLELCIKTVIPSLFPFFVLSMLLTSRLDSGSPGPAKKVCAVLGIPESAASVLVPAFLGGYPVGANCIGKLYHTKQISPKEARRMLAFCSNAGPSFLFGMVSGYFPNRKVIWILWLVHLISAVLTALVLPGETPMQREQNCRDRSADPSIILSAAKAMCLVCCWVILFRTVITFLKEWFLWRFPQWAQVLFMGILELTNGCCELLLIGDVRLRFVLCACLLAFGGICVVCQTASVIGDLPVACYVKGKLIQTGFSFLLSSAITMKHGILLLPVIPVLIIAFRKIQKRYGNYGILPV